VPFKTIEILLAEDNPADLRLAHETLLDYKMQNTLHVVKDGESALHFLQRRGKYANAPIPDLVLLDLALPKLDGIEILTAMKEDVTLRHMPVVLLTASSMDQEMLRNFDIKPDCFILKPLTLERFLDAVRCFPQMGLSIVKIAAGAG